MPENDFKCDEKTSKFNKDYIKSCNDDSDERSFLKFDVQYPENFHNLHNDLSFLPKKKVEKVEKLVVNSHDKEKYAIHVRNLKQTINHELVPKR